MSQDLVEELQRSYLLKDIPRKHLKRLADAVEIREVPAGTQIVREGDSSREFFFVLSGVASVSVRGKTIGGVGRGNTFGEIGILEHTTRTATITADGPTTLAVIGAQDFQDLLESERTFAVHLVNVLAQRLEELTRKPAGERP